MNTATIDTAQLKQQTDLRELAGRYTELKGNQEMFGPCPKCGGNKRFHVKADWFFCRDCFKVDDKRFGHDVIGFLQWMGLARDFKDAAAMLGGHILPTTAQPRQAPKRSQPAPQSPEWKAKAAELVRTANDLLLNDSSELAKQGRQYLLGRGLQPHTWQQFQLGIGQAALPGTEGKQRQPAIVIPWIVGGAVVAVRYRFLAKHTYTDSEGQGRTEKQTALHGSQFGRHLFGQQGLLKCAEAYRMLIICEGEINALSIWRIAHQSGVDVLSLGSESQQLTPAMIAYAKLYRQVMVWADRSDIAKSLMASLPGAFGVSSPNGQDANDLLQAGQLGGYLSKWRLDLVADDPQGQKALLWNLYDAQPLDAGGAIVMTAIAQRLGIEL